MAEIDIRFNDTLLYRRSTPESIPCLCPENPSYNLAFFTPTVSFSFNETDDYSDNIFHFSLRAPTGFGINSSGRGSYWSIGFHLLGFGFSLSRQSDY